MFVPSMYETIELERRGAAAVIRLNRPESLNAWNEALGTDLLAAVRSVAADGAVRAVCVTGAGRAFSSGADLRDLGARPLTPEGHVDVRSVLTQTYHPLLNGLRTMPAGRRCDQRARCRDRLLAGAVVRSGRGRRVRLPAAGLREHRARP